jgi:class 3 adenylate cyclase
MDFYAVVEQVLALLRSRGRVPYRALKLQLQLDDDAIEALKDQLIYAQHVALDEDDRVLVWTGEGGTTPEPARQPSVPLSPESAPADLRTPEAERRQLTVLFCDLVDSTVLASQLDPEEWRAVVRAYQDTCAIVIARYDGHIAQYLGDGLLVYFGYPLAHEDDAQRAVRTGLGLLEAMETLNSQLERDKGRGLAVRIGIHTGLVVVGEMGGGGRQEHLALGDTPNVAARLQGLAAPDTVVISAATHRLVQGYFTVAELSPQVLKGVAAPVPEYRILGASAAQSRLDVAAPTGWTPRTHLSQLTLGRLPRAHVEQMVRQLTGDKPLPAEVLAQVIAKTDGVPLFVEELVKVLLESGLLREEVDRYVLTGPLPPLAIPAMLQDSLMARLDRLARVREVAQRPSRRPPPSPLSSWASLIPSGAGWSLTSRGRAGTSPASPPKGIPREARGSPPNSSSCSKRPCPPSPGWRCCSGRWAYPLVGRVNRRGSMRHRS